MSYLRRAHELAEDDPVPVQGGAAAAGEVRGGEARSRPARSVGLGGLGGGVEVELVGLVDEHHPDRQVVVVDVVDPVHQGDLLGEHVGGAEVGRVRRVGDQREPVGAQAHLGAGRLARVGRGVPEGGLVELGLHEAALRCGHRAAEVGQVEAVVAVVRRVDVPRPLRAGPAHGRVEAGRRQVEADRGGRVGHAATGVRRDLGVGRRQPRLHDRRLGDRERHQLAVGRGHPDRHRRRARSLARRVGEPVGQRLPVQRVALEGAWGDPGRVSALRRPRLFRRRRPVAAPGRWRGRARRRPRRRSPGGRRPPARRRVRR